ncbi:hypothetical protein F5Y15DRAFT_370149 [Xylariaceae sp. FL0016]|nr:hypothetical protein F5Y15DRAFT_370149 [Xylariaceae sp. FL0016]
MSRGSKLLQFIFPVFLSTSALSPFIFCIAIFPSPCFPVENTYGRNQAELRISTWANSSVRWFLPHHWQLYIARILVILADIRQCDYLGIANRTYDVVLPGALYPHVGPTFATQPLNWAVQRGAVGKGGQDIDEDAQGDDLVGLLPAVDALGAVAVPVSDVGDEALTAGVDELDPVPEDGGPGEEVEEALVVLLDAAGPPGLVLLERAGEDDGGALGEGEPVGPPGVGGSVGDSGVGGLDAADQLGLHVAGEDLRILDPVLWLWLRRRCGTLLPYQRPLLYQRQEKRGNDGNNVVRHGVKCFVGYVYNVELSLNFGEF